MKTDCPLHTFDMETVQVTHTVENFMIFILIWMC